MSDKIPLYIGRFQPFHEAHLATVRRAIKKYGSIIIGIGSAQIGSMGHPRTERCPWTAEERRRMIEDSLSLPERDVTMGINLRDFPDDNDAWVRQVRAAATYLAEGKKIVLMGWNKDDTSFYLKLFPEWERDEAPSRDPSLGATAIRAALKAGEPPEVWAKDLPYGVRLYVEELRRNGITA